MVRPKIPSFRLHPLLISLVVCTTAFYVPGNLARAMTEFRNSSFGARVNAFVKGVRVKTTHLGYRKTVKALSNFNARQYSFDSEFGKVTVEAYFKQSSIIQYPILSASESDFF